MAKIDSSLFSSDSKINADAIFEAYGDCPDCGGKLKIRYANKSAFLGCISYPNCHYKKSLTDTAITTVKVMVDTPCPQCDKTLAIKKGRYGLFIGCVDFPSCEFLTSIKQQTDTHVNCPQCHTGHLLEKTNKFGKKFYSCDTYPSCKFVLNDKPVACTCPDCHSPIMIEYSVTQFSCVKPTCNGVINRENNPSS